MAPTLHSVIVLAAGKGTRMRSDRPKVLHEIGRCPLLRHVLETAKALAPRQVVVVAGPGMEEVERTAKAAVPDVRIAVQARQLGTGDAVRVALAGLDGRAGDVLVLYGDTPLIRPETIRAMQPARAGGAGIVVLGFRPKDPARYGRLVASAKGEVDRIVEYADASEEERKIGLCNSGIFLIDGEHIDALVAEIGSDNAKGEFYFTDIVAIGRKKGLKTVAVEADPGEVLGVNSRAELAAAEALFQERARAAAMNGGATLIDPASIHLAADTRLGKDVVIGPSVVFGPGVSIEDGVTIDAFCHIEAAHVKSGARIGPFARLRPGAEIGEDAHIGNFVEIKKAVIETGAKVNHLTYIGDARIGVGTNVGAGTITCNYDGFDKHHTEIGAGAFIGSNTALIAPVKIGDGAYIGSGSVIARDVEPDALALTRAELVEKPGWAAKFRARKKQSKAGKE